MLIMSYVIALSAISLLLVGTFIQSLIYIRLFWNYKKLIGAMVAIAYAISAALLIYYNLSVFSLLFCLLTIYQVINCLRLVQNRMHKEYLIRSASQTLLLLFIAQLITLLFWWQYDILTNLSNGQLQNIYSIIVIIVALVILFSTAFNIINSKPRKTASFSDKELPTATLAIPARNENLTLTECLEAAINSNYPKLEIIVLDDCSQDKTAEIIKSYAQKGVRFIQGMQPNESWLAKNSAYQILLEQASGELIIYMGVDVRLSENSIKNAIENYLSLNTKMLSIMPKRKKSGLLAAFVQPTRYWWELAVPRLFTKRPPVLSTFWLTDKHLLQKNGGFIPFARSIVPEEKLAKLYSKTKSYAFLRTDNLLPIHTQKDFLSQWNTAIRTRYPQVHKKPEMVALRTLALLTFVIAPFFYLLFIPFANNISPFTTLAIITSCVLYVFSHTLIAIITNPISAIIAPFNFPIVMIIDLVATHISMYRYEFGEVIWKGRNVTTAAMHVYPHLPPLDEPTT